MNDARIEELRQQLKNAGLNRLVPEIGLLARDSIRITATSTPEDEVEIGGSKLGGTPDLPAGTTWPEFNGVPLALLAQLRLQDCASYDHERLLPHSGILYFFYNAEDQKWGFDPQDRGNWRVIYYDGDSSGLSRSFLSANLPEGSRFRTCKIALANEMTLPSWQSEAIRRLNLSDDEWKRYADFPGAGCIEGTPVHRLLGHPEQIQGDMQLECQLVSNGLYAGDSSGYKDPRAAMLKDGAADWQLLLQIDSDEDNLGTMWGDVGRVYFWIRQQELRSRDFSNVWLILQCY